MLFFLNEDTPFFEKARFGVPKPCLLRFRLAAGVFVFCFLENDMPFGENVCVGHNLTFLVNI